MAETVNILFLGDIVGENGVATVADSVPALRRDFKADFIIANAENAQNGKGINVPLAGKLKRAGINVLTSGNHIWDIRNRDILKDENFNNFVLRPANYPDKLPGKGIGYYRLDNEYIAVVNLQGLTFMENISCPFSYLENRLTEIRTKTKIIIVDFHAEATSEKQAFAGYFDGKVSAVLGTHTHVMTADEKVTEQGTGYITDVGMCGPINSVLGMDMQQAIERFINRIPNHYKLSKNPVRINGVGLVIDKFSGKCLNIERIIINP